MDSRVMGPIPESERIQILDVLRDVAFLGILITIIQHLYMFGGGGPKIVVFFRPLRHC